MFSFLKKKPKEEMTFCVCVITSYAVTASVVKQYRREGSVSVPVVLFSCEEKIPLYHDRHKGILEKLVAVHTGHALERCRAFAQKFDKVICTIGEPWVTTRTRSVHLEKPKPFKVTEKAIREQLARDQRLFEHEISHDTRGGEELGIVGMSKPIIDINGYQTSEYVGVVAKTVDAHVSFSLAPVFFIESLLGACADVFHHTDMIFTSLDIAQTFLMTKTAHAATLTIGGISSTLAVVNKGRLTHTVSIPEGLFGFEQHLLAQFDIQRTQVPSVMQFASDEKFLEHERDVYYARIRASYHDLSAALRLGILDLKKYTQVVPEPLYVMGNPSWLPILESLLVIDAGSIATVPHPDALDRRIAYAHEARVKNLPLSLAILQAVNTGV